MSTMPNLPPVEITESVEALWGIALQPVGCLHCGQAFLAEADYVGHLCPYCASGKLESQPARLRPEPPELLVPFAKGRAEVLAAYQRFVNGVWLHTDDFNPESLLRRTVPVFWPVWLLDSQVCGNWQAEIGFDYQVKSSQEFFQAGGWHTRQVVEKRVRWEPRLGSLERFYENIRVPALTEHQKMMKMVGEYQLDHAESYQAEKTRKAALQVPDLQPENAWPLAQANLDRAAADECRQAAEGQHVRNFSIKADYQDLHWTQLLLPVYLSYYTDDDGKPQLVYVNGQTGVTGGVRLASQHKGWKWAGMLAGGGLILFVLGLLAFALTTLFPPLNALGIFLVLAALGLIASAIVPAVWPWQWNRGQQPPKIIRS